MQRRRMMFGAVALGFGMTIGLGCGHGEEPEVEASKGPASGPAAWARVFGAAGDQMGFLVDATPNGDVLAVGTMAGTVDFGPGGKLSAQSESDLYIAWLSSDGAIQKARKFGGGGAIVPLGLAIDASAGLLISGLVDGDIDLGQGKLTGSGDTDAFLASLGPNGQYRYALRLSGTGIQVGGEVVVAPDGNAIWMGTFEGTVDIGGAALTSAGGGDVFVAKIDPSGHALWARSLGGAGEDADLGLVIDGKGRVIVGGLYQGAPDLGKGALPDTGQDGGEMLVALDASGQTIYSRGVPNKDGFFPFSMQTSADGSVFLVGQLMGKVDAFGKQISVPSAGIGVVKLDDAGAAVSTQVFPADRASHILAAKQKGGGLVIGGHFGGSFDVGGKTLKSAGGDDLFVLWMDGSGHVTRQERLGGAGRERLGDLALLSSGQVLVTGSFDGTTTLGAGNITSGGGPDAFVALLR